MYDWFLIIMKTKLQERKKKRKLHQKKIEVQMRKCEGSEQRGFMLLWTSEG